MATQSRVELPNGLSMEYYHSTPTTPATIDEPLVFVHGSGRAGWCWAENWMDYLADNGVQSFAVSLRGTSGSPPPDGAKSVTLKQHVGDLDAFVRSVVNPQGTKAPVFVCHSLGGLTLMNYLSDSSRPASGAAFYCSVPPSGNGPMTTRFLSDRGFGVFLDLIRGFVFNGMYKNERLARRLFYPSGGSETEEFIQMAMNRIKGDYQVKLDAASLRSGLPIENADSKGRAFWLTERPGMEYLVVGAVDDYIVDEQGVQELAKFLDVTPEFLGPGQAHDLMLQIGWERGAEQLLRWITGLPKANPA